MPTIKVGDFVRHATSNFRYRIVEERPLFGTEFFILERCVDEYNYAGVLEPGRMMEKIGEWRCVRKTIFYRTYLLDETAEEFVARKVMG